MATASSRPVIVAVAGGKGGVGKTVLSAAMSMILARTGLKTILVDADLGGANLQQALMISSPVATLHDFFINKISQLAGLLHTSFMPNLSLIFGSQDAMGLANLKSHLKARLINQLRSLESDYVILDLGAGLAYNELDLFNQADVGYVVITPEPPAVRNGFNFIRHCLLRRMHTYFRNRLEIQHALHNELDANDRLVTLSSLGRKIKSSGGDDLYDEWRNLINDFMPHIILNMVETRQDYSQGMAAVIAANDLLSMRIHHLHPVRRDEWLRQAVQDGRLHQILMRKEGAISDIRQLVRPLSTGHSFIPAPERMQATCDAARFRTEDRVNICSIRCYQWKSCGMKNGGYPCRIHAWLKPLAIPEKIPDAVEWS